jgi:hypothetical protein
MKLCEDPKIVDLINAHTLHFDQQTLQVDPDDGYFSDENIRSSPHLFFRYQVFLFQVLEQLLQKAPFQLVPQFTMKRRSITLGVEQVAELMQRLSKTPGLLESIGIDFGAIPSHDDVFLTNTDNRLKKQREAVASHGQKRKRVQELKKELTDVHLPVQKRLCTESCFRKGTGTCTYQCRQDSESGSGHIQDKTNKTEESGRSVKGSMEKVSPDGCCPSFLSTTRRTEALKKA